MLTKFYFGIIERANIEESKSNITINTWLPQASYLCDNFSGISSLKFQEIKGLIGHTFMVYTKNQNQRNLYPFVLLEISVLNESTLGHLHYLLTDVPLQPNSLSDNIFNPRSAY